MPNIFSSEKRLDWFLRLVLVAAVVLVFAPALRGGFLHWDDGSNIAGNPHLGLKLENIIWMFTDTSFAPRYMPLGWLTYSVNHVLFGGTPLSYHLANLVLQALNAILMFAILKQFLRLLAKDSEVQPGLLQFAAAAGALWWAINPLRTETVAWACGLLYCVAGLFFFLAMWAYLRQGDSNLGPEQRRRWVWLAAAFFAASLFTYPIAMGALVVFIALDLSLLRRLPLHPKTWWLPEYRRVWAEKLLFLVPVLGAAAANYHGISAANGVNQGWSNFGIGAHCMQALWVWAWYVWKPWLPFDLAPKYPDLLTDVPFTPMHLSAALLVVAITVLAILRRRVWPWLLTVWVCYLAMVSPFIGLTEHPLFTNDRYNYIVGGIWGLLVAWGLTVLLRRQQLRLVLATVVTLWCTYMGWQAQQQTIIWNNSLNLHTWMAQILGDEAESGIHEIGKAHLLYLLKRPDEATIAVRRGVSLWPQSPVGWEIFGDLLADQRRFEPAIASYHQALLRNPKYQQARAHLAASLMSVGRDQEAVAELTELLRQNPRHAEAHAQLAQVLERLGHKDEAQKHREEARHLRSQITPSTNNSDSSLGIGANL